MIVQGRLPIQMPWSERLAGAGAGFAGDSSSESEWGFEGFIAGGLGRILPFLAFRMAFLEGGSGAVTSTSNSSAASWSLLRFLGGDGDAVRGSGDGNAVRGSGPIVECASLI